MSELSFNKLNVSDSLDELASNINQVSNTLLFLFVLTLFYNYMREGRARQVSIG